MKIGLFGGTFNPIHYGHLRGAEEVREFFNLDRIIFIPAGNPPLKSSDIADSLHRFKMTEIAILGNPYFEISDYEVKNEGPSYSIKTIAYFKKLYESHTLFFIMGVDSFLELRLWHKHWELLKMIDFIVMSRPGFNNFEESEFIACKEKDGCYRIKNSEKRVFYLEILPCAISSSQLRELIRRGKSIRYLVPDRLMEYIKENQLYRE